MTEVPAQLKIDTGWFYGEANNDRNPPLERIQNVIKLINSLKTTMKLTGIHDHDAFLEYQERGAKKALYILDHDRNPGQAIIYLNQILGELQFLIYNDQYVTKPDRDTWQGRNK